MSLERLTEHRRLWREKPVLARVYEPWFRALLAPVPHAARVLEIGAGPGLLSEFAGLSRPDIRWIASDLHAAPWNTLAADACRLPLRAASIDAVVGLDVLHHLDRPAGFFAEAARVLSPGGRLALVEPWITPLSFLVYRFFHQEECRISVDGWQAFPAGKASFDGNAAIPWRLHRDTTEKRWNDFGLGRPRVERVNTFAYLLSLGFRAGSLLPPSLVRAMMTLDRLSAPLATITALRAVIAWDRESRRDSRTDEAAPLR